jgi:uncharacterized protein
MIFLTGCGGLFYHPTSYLYSDPHTKNLTFTNEYISTSDNHKVHSWFFNTPVENKEKSLVLFFHGNAQNLSAHYLNFEWLPKAGHDFIIFDYRGYGITPGNPSAKGLHQDALAMINFAKKTYKQNKDKYKKFILYAQSLGSIVALRALADIEDHQFIDLLVLDSPFDSYLEIAQEKVAANLITIPFYPLTYLLFSDEMAPKKFISSFKIPTLVIHSINDPIVPYKLGRKLYNTLETTKWFWKLESPGHTDIFFVEKGKYRKKFLDFIEKI